MRLLNFKIPPFLICRQTFNIEIHSAGGGKGFNPFPLDCLNNFQLIPHCSAAGQSIISRIFNHAWYWSSKFTQTCRYHHGWKRTMGQKKGMESNPGAWGRGWVRKEHRHCEQRNRDTLAYPLCLFRRKLEETKVWDRGLDEVIKAVPQKGIGWNAGKRHPIQDHRKNR